MKKQLKLFLFLFTCTLLINSCASMKSCDCPGIESSTEQAQLKTFRS